MNVEKSVLGSMIKENHLIKDTVLKPHHFEDNRHKQLLHTMIKLSNEGKSVDKVTLSMLPNLLNIGGISYINECVTYANVDKFENYEDIILESWRNREKRNVLNVALTDDWEIGKVVEKLDNLNESRVDDHADINDVLADIYELPFTEQKEKPSVTTGLKKLDHMTGGFSNGTLSIIAARPSMGKSDVMLHLAKQAGWSGYLPIIFSLEMSKRDLVQRMVASTGHYNRTRLRNPYKGLSDSQKETWAKVTGRVGETNVQIFDAPGQTISEMRAKTRKLIAQYPDKRPVILVDYLTLIRSEQYPGGSGHQQVTEISRGLLGMAKEFDCPVISLAQLSRAVEKRENKIPQMSDIRESGSIEQDAHLIIFLYRDKYYNKQSQDNTLQLIIAKQRSGPIGNVKTIYNEHTGEITDAD